MVAFVFDVLKDICKQVVIKAESPHQASGTQELIRNANYPVPPLPPPGPLHQKLRFAFLRVLRRPAASGVLTG